MALKSILFYNEAIHGTAFNLGSPVSYLHGNVGDRVKVVAEFESVLRTTSDDVDYFEYIVVSAGVSGKVTRQVGSFLDDGFFPGQQVELLEIGGTAQRQIVKLTFVADDYLAFDLLSGTMTSGIYDGNTNGTMQATCTTDLSGVVYRYGVIENNESTNYFSKYNGRSQEFKGYGIAPGVATNMNANQGAHVNGSALWQYLGNNNGVHTTRVTHIFVIPPMYLDEYANNLEDDTVPSLFLTQNTVKYVLQAELRFDNNNPNNLLLEEFDQYKGSVGWYNEQLDSNTPAFSITDLTYEEANTGKALDSIKPDVRCIAVAQVTGAFISTTNVVSKILTARPAINYTRSNDNFADTFLYDSLGVTGSNIQAGTGIIKSVRTIINSPTQAEVRITIEYSTSQLASLGGDPFILALSFADQAKALNVSNKCTMLLDFQDYEIATDIPDLVTWGTTGVKAHNDTATLKTSYRGWPRDGVRIEWAAEIELGSIIAGLRYAVVAMTDQGDRFEVNSFQAPLGNPPVAIAGAQVFSIDDLRGYKLSPDDPFNELSLETTSESPFTVAGVAGFRVGWQSWIFNGDVPADFVDPTKPNNGLNQLASDKADNGYKLYLGVILTIQHSTGVQTDYEQLINMDIYPYNEDAGAPPEWTSAITLRDPSGNETGVFDQDGYTHIRVVFTPASGATADYTGIQGWIGLEKLNQPGEALGQLSSLQPTFPQNILEPLTGQTLLKKTVAVGTVTFECRVHARNLERGATYIPSARIFTGAGVALAPVFRFDAVTYVGGGDFTIPIHAKLGAGGALPAGKQVTINVLHGATLQEQLTGVTGDDISNYTTTHATPANSFKEFANDPVTDGGTLDFDKLAWAEQNDKTNANADTITLQSKAVDRGQTSATDSEVIPVQTIPGQGFPKDIEYLDANTMVWADHLTGIRTFKGDAYTELLGMLTGALSVAVDNADPTNPIIYCPNSLRQIKYWRNAERRDLGGSGVAKTMFIETFLPNTIYVNPNQTSLGYSHLWLAGPTNLALRYRNGVAFSKADFSSKITAISATANVQNVCVDANGLVWVLCNVPGSGSLIISMAKTGGGLYTDPTQWTATLRISNPGTGTTNGISGTARFSGDCRKIIIIGYDGNIGTMTGTNPMLLISDYGNDFYRLLWFTAGAWTVAAPALYCGTSGTNTYSFGSSGSNIQVGKVSGMCYVDGVGTPGKFYGTGEGTPDRIIFILEDYANAASQLGDSIFEGTTGYLEQTVF